MQHELEASFIYEDTPDQLKSTAEVKADMERDRPMDRLICGDVGFGKTEIAIRAAFKAACDNKQVAVLVPTTVLAFQHFKTFSERLKDFPVKVSYLSRARTSTQIKETIKGIADGSTGELTLEASLDRPGFLYVTATALDENGNPAPESDGFFGGAGVDISDIRSVTQEPDDYHAFWDACKTELLAVEPEIIEKIALPDDPEHPHHRIYDVKLACAGGKPVSGILTIPKDEKKRPCRVVYQGYGVKSAWFNFSEEENMLLYAVKLSFRKNEINRFIERSRA